MMLHHGGRLRQAVKQYGIPLSDWLDLSTGINPHAWPVAEKVTFTENDWLRLPEVEDALPTAMTQFFGVSQGLACAGSQAAIQAMPELLPRGQRVTVLPLSYAEHAHCWRRAGHHITAVSREAIDAQLPHTDVLQLVNPNNPTGEVFDLATLRRWHDQLAERGGLLVVDEAFMDATPTSSLLQAFGNSKHLVVLRSLGKFFGLAGARVGFVFAHESWLTRLQSALGPWTVTGPSRRVASVCLNDERWIQQTREDLPIHSARLHDVLSRYGLKPSGGSALFQWCKTDQAASIQHAFAQRGVLIRRFEAPNSLRFGLPKTEQDWARLTHCLQQGVG